MTESAQYWKLASEKIYKQLKTRLAEKFNLRKHPTEECSYELLDNFEWDLWHSDTLLFRSNKQYLLQTPESEFSETAKVRSPKFWWDFPEGEFQNALKDGIDLWALIPICELKFKRLSLDILNSDEKVVARVSLTIHTEASQEEEDKQAFYLSLLPLRGYDKEFKAVAKCCSPELNMPDTKPTLRTLIKTQGIEIKPKSTKSFGISADEPAEKAVREMIATMLAKARTYEDGVTKDIDTEFLHQYRVSLRKARSLVNLMKQVLPGEMPVELKTKLARLAGPTNNQRDLDVFLLNRNIYEKLLPENFAKGVDELFTHFHKERNAAYKEVKKFFSTKEYQTIVSAIESAIVGEPVYESKAAETPIYTLAKKRVLKRYHKIRQLGQAIGDETADEEVHELRIECKKLRYLMEFFAELFPTKRVGKLTKSLKSLQTILGDFNDYSVQKEFLSAHATDCTSSDMLAAINGLIAVLHQKQVEERAKVCEAFATFGNEIVSTEFELLFG